MDSVEGPTSTADAAVVIDSSPPPPPHDLVSSPVGSPVHEVASDFQAAASPSDEEDHDHDLVLEEQHKEDEHSSSTVSVLTDDLKHKIIKQVEYYFSDENLPTDKYMMGLIRKNKEGLVPISAIASFRKMKKLTRDYAIIVAALRESSLLHVSSSGKKVKRLNPLPVTEVRDPKLFTVLVENLPEDHSVGNIRRIFAEAGNIKNISICDPNAVEESKKGGKNDMLISGKLHALVEYETAEAADKAVATLNDEHDWRSGMRVKLLKRVAMYNQRRQAWRGPDNEKKVVGQASNQTRDHDRKVIGQTSNRTRDEEKNKSTEHQDDIPDEEEGDHLSNEKNGQKGRNRDRSRRQRYRGNGHGHGTTYSHHVAEASKPPPGPRMPDGTRGFAMGRGRPPVSTPAS